MSKNDRFIPLRVILKLIILMTVLYKLDCAHDYAFMQQKEKKMSELNGFPDK